MMVNLIGYTMFLFDMGKCRNFDRIITYLDVSKTFKYVRPIAFVRMKRF